MNAFLPLDGIELWHVAGWTMIHFLWAGALAALAGGLLRIALRRTSAEVRYASALACLAVLAALPLAIGAWVAKTQAGAAALAAGAIELDAGPQATIVEEAAPDGGIIELSGREVLEPAVDAIAEPVGVVSEPGQVREPAAAEDAPAWQVAIDWLEACAAYLPWVWLIGTPVTLALLLTGVVGTRRLRRASAAIDGGPVAETLAQLQRSLRVSRRVTVALCERIAAPVLVGIVRPMILLPPSALTGWSPDEIEMVLVHELAHVRRWDNLVNLLQRLVESLLFFHPAVGLASGWVRREREACCDAVVVRHTNRPHAYAELLVALAAQMPRSVLFHPAATSAMAAGPLRGRIRRILQMEDDPMLVSGKSLLAAAAALLLAATLAVLYLPTVGQAEESATEVTEHTEAAETDEASASEDHPVGIEEEGVLDPHARDDDPDADDGLVKTDKEIAEEPQLAEGEELVASFPWHASREELLRAISPVVQKAQTTSIGSANRRELLRAISPVVQKGLIPELITRDAQRFLIAKQPPSEADWPDILGEPPRKERVIAEKAYQRLGLKVVPVTTFEEELRETLREEPRRYLAASGIRIVGGNVPDGLPLPSFLTKVDGQDIENLDRLLVWLDSERGRRADAVRCYAVADSKEYLFDGRPVAPAEPLQEPADAAEPQELPAEHSAAPDAADKSQLRYEGKSFAEWRDLWKHELSTEKRTEAVKALAAFGRAGYGKEAAEAILDVAGEYDFSAHGTELEKQLKEQIHFALARIPIKNWLAPLRERYEADPRKWESFAVSVVAPARAVDDEVKEARQELLLRLARDGSHGTVSRALPALVASDPALENEAIHDVVRSKLAGDDIEITIAIQALRAPRVVPPELIELLLHGDAAKQRTARQQLKMLGPSTFSLMLLEAMGEILQDDERANDHLAALRTFAAARIPGPHHDVAEPLLMEFVETGEPPLKVAAACALERMGTGSAQALLDENLKDDAGVPLPEIPALIEAEKLATLGGQW